MTEFETKDSGVREEYPSGMRRDTQEGKPRFDLVLAPVPYEDQLLTRWAHLMARGAEKYGERNWQEADSYEEHDRFVASGLRHMMQWANGERDEDHAAAVMFNLMAAEYMKTKLKLTPTEEQYAQAYPEGSSRGEDSSSGNSCICPDVRCNTGARQASSTAPSGDIPGSGNDLESGGDVQPAVYRFGQCADCPGDAVWPGYAPEYCNSHWF